jgi:diaminopimelate decarboxylase
MYFLMKPNLSVKSIEKAFQSALKNGLIRDEDTLLICYDLTFLEERIRHLISLFPPTAVHGIAMKANPLLRILEFCKSIGTGVEVASLGELVMALKAGYNPGRIIYDSPVKTMEDLRYALKAGVHINADSFMELGRIKKLKERITTSGTVGIRINPQVGVGKILESSVAGEYSKFGIPFRTKRDELIRAFAENPWLTGVHLHIGSQGCSPDMLLDGIGVIYDFVNEVNHTAGFNQVRIFDIGGGLPVSYSGSVKPVSMEEYSRAIRDKFPLLFTDHCSLFTEFGRWVHVNAGWAVSRVEYVKKDPGINTAMIHAGADLFLRECLNPKDWQHEYSVLDKNGNLKHGWDINPYNLAGPLCFSGDILAKNVHLPVVEEGDYIIIHDAGGYTFSMWSRYNSRQTPRIIGYYDDGRQFEILKERESLEEMRRFWA